MTQSTYDLTPYCHVRYSHVMFSKKTILYISALLGLKLKKNQLLFLKQNFDKQSKNEILLGNN